jgi:WD40 repeat protein
LRTIWGHDGGITSIHVDPNYLCSSSMDKSIKFWDKSYGDCVFTLLGHDSVVKCVKVVGNDAISCGGDGVKIWDIRSGNCTRSIKGEDTNTIEINGDVLYSGNKGGDLVFHDFRSDKILATWNFGFSIHTMHLQEDMLVFGGHNMDPTLFCLQENTVLDKFVGHHGNIHCLYGESNVLVSGGSDSCIKLWYW